MVQAIVNLNERENRILNIVKGKFGLRNKSEAISLVINEYERELLEPELRPEFIEKMRKREKEPTVKVKDFRKHFGLK
jgi:aspartate aminotransferase-like enzyme